MESERDRASAEVGSRWGWREREREIEADVEVVLVKDGSLEWVGAVGRVFWRFVFRFWSFDSGLSASVSSENKEWRKTLV